MIKSNIIGEDRNIYMSYLNDHYKHKWTMSGTGERACPVIALDTINKMFGIDVDIKSVPNYMMNTDGVNAQYGIINPVVNMQQLKALAHTYKLLFKKSYVDLVAAHELYLYDLHKSNLLELLVRDMYNAVQLHQEFCEAVCVFNKNHGHPLDNQPSIYIDVNPANGIYYKELMDYAHYNGAKPKVSFKIKHDKITKLGVMDENDFELSFNGLGYNINIKNIKYLQ